jgi:hypothetical protein
MPTRHLLTATAVFCAFMPALAQDSAVPTEPAPSATIVRNAAGDGIDHITIAATKDDLKRIAAFKPLSRQNQAERQASLTR